MSATYLRKLPVPLCRLSTLQARVKPIGITSNQNLANENEPIFLANDIAGNHFFAISWSWDKEFEVWIPKKPNASNCTGGIINYMMSGTLDSYLDWMVVRMYWLVLGRWTPHGALGHALRVIVINSAWFLEKYKENPQGQRMDPLWSTQVCRFSLKIVMYLFNLIYRVYVLPYLSKLWPGPYGFRIAMHEKSMCKWESCI